MILSSLEILVTLILYPLFNEKYGLLDKNVVVEECNVNGSVNVSK